MAAKKIMITGVYGLIASAVYEHLVKQPEKYDVYAMARRRTSSSRAPEGRSLDIADEKFFIADLSDLNALRAVFEGMDCVVHMAADPDPASAWKSILHSNIIGGYHAFEACRLAQVSRVIFASSGGLMLGYLNDEPYKAISQCRFDDVPDELPVLTHLDPPRPTEPYTASKVWGEALARCYADVHGLSCICLRIGWVNSEDQPVDPSLAWVWCSQRDIAQLVQRCIDAPDELRFDVFYGTSNNKHNFFDTSHARQVVGYVPQDRAEGWVR